MKAVALALTALCLAGGVSLGDITVHVVDQDGNAMVNGFRWMVEQDTTTITVPGAHVANSVALSIHQSYCPVVTNGHEVSATAVIAIPATNRYVVSVLPDSGYTMSATTISNGQTSATVVVHATPVPTAQISILAFNDNSPINNAQDATEPGLAGFKVVISDNAGMVSQDAFGNPLGTTYQQDTNGVFITDLDGAPVVDMMGDGDIVTDTNGVAVIKYLMPARYAVQVIPPPDQTWHQTTTIDGTPRIDAWVKLNEPAALVEFGMVSRHVNYGFVNPSLLPWALSPPTTGATVTGRLVDNHFAKPPAINASFPGEPVPEGLIGLNDATAPTQGLYAALCNADGTFTITNVPPGTYQLVTWDKPLDLTIGFNTVTVPSNSEVVALGDVLCLRWHGRLMGSVFYDTNENGFRDPGEVGMRNQAVNIRNRDGTIVQSTATDDNGNYSFREIPLFFKWYIAEINYDRYKPTGMTAAVDEGGGPIPPADGWTMPSFGILNPQPQFETDADTGLCLTNASGDFIPIINPNTGNHFSRTETGPALLEAMMNMQVNVIDWGKVNYSGDENGGIVGITYYDTTRAENDPGQCAGEPWEPGIPRVQVNLYTDSNHDKIIDDLNEDGHVTPADVDNYPFGWQDGSEPKGSEDVDRNTNGVFDAGDAIQIVHTDSWDDNTPTGSIQTNAHFVSGQSVKPGYDAFGTWDQVRPGVFDGGYWFNSYFPGGIDSGSDEVAGLPTGTYIVEAVAPPGYEIVKEEDKNVDFGDAYTPSPLQLLPECVGDPHVVPAELSLFPGVPAHYAGATRKLPDRKRVSLTQEKNVNCDFFFFTAVPKAARVVGLVTDDLHANFDPNHPFYGEKATPSWIPISFQDFAGHEVARTYCDEYGSYNAMLPSTYSVNVPSPSGVSPMMITIVLNPPTMPDPVHPGQVIADPFYDPDYVTGSATLDFWPGTTTYADTPALPQGAFVGYPNGRMDTEPTEGTPVIFSAEGPGGGPLLANSTEVLTIRSMGQTMVPNPLYLATNGLPVMITRDFGFGSVTGTVTVNGMPLKILSWATNVIRATAPTSVPTGQLMVRRGDNGLSTRTGLTLTVGAPIRPAIHVRWAPYPAHPIQDAIDAANPGDLILVDPGTYEENPIMWKPVKLQGAGARSTTISASLVPYERLTAWHAKVRQILGTPDFDPFAISDGPGILVLGDAGVDYGAIHAPRIDGFQITGAAVGGAIMVNTKAHYLQISNNRLKGNNGSYAGGISVGTPNTGLSASNDHVVIRYNEILKNGSTGRAGTAGAGGVGLYTGADDYMVSDNLIQGNLSTANGAGMAHIGLSQRGRMTRNTVLFNEAISDLPGMGYGGGIFIAGETTGEALTPGAGTVTVDGNLIQGNLSGAGHGGGIRADNFNGQDVAISPGNADNWHALYIFNNMVVNNVAGYAGGGISLQDVARGVVIHNTVANNDSCATALVAFPAAGGNSEPQGAGLVTHAHSASLAALFGQTFTNPVLYDNIFWHNRSSYVDVSLNGGAGGLVPNPVSPYWDLQVFGTTNRLNPRYCILSSTGGYHSSNIASNPLFIAEYTNANLIAAVPDEGGNAVSLRFSPIHPTGDYHILSSSPARDRAELSFVGTYPLLQGDFDTDYRPYFAFPSMFSDIGADEYSVAAVFATSDSYFVNEDTTLTVARPGVLANDRPAGIIALVDTSPAHGTLNLSTNGRIHYTPAPNFQGTDTFKYRAVLRAARSRPAMVTVTVRPVTDPPVAAADSYTVTGNGSITVPAPGVLANDSDLNGYPITAVLTVPPTHGVLSLNANGSFTYTPTVGYTGTDTCRYRARNGTLNSGQATVTLTVTAPTPDFMVDSIVVTPDPVSSGGLFSATITVTNRGTAAGSAGRLSIWRDLPGGDVPVDTAADDSISLGTVGIGDATTRTFTALSPPAIVPPGASQYSATFRAFVNSQGTQTEVSQTNNQLTKAYTVASTVVADHFPPDTDGIDTDGDGNVSNDNVQVHLAAGDGFIRMADGLDLYCFGFSDATGLTAAQAMMMNMLYAGTPAPTLVFREGQRVYLKLTNVGMMMRPDLFDPHSVHFHGFPNAAPIFDGEPMASISVNMGSTLTYYYEPVEPGTFMYHCHVEATEHMQMGMLGMLWVEPKQNMLPDGTDLNGFVHHAGYKYAYNDGDGSTRYDRDLPLQITGMDSDFHTKHLDIQPLPMALMKDDYFLLNGRGYPDTINTNPVINMNGHPSQVVHAKLVANVGDKILLRISSLATVDFTTLRVLGLPMTVIGRGARLLQGPDPDGDGPLRGKNLYYRATSVTVGGGEAVDAILDTTGAAPGTYFIYSSNLDQLSNGAEDYGGVMTEIELQ